MVNPKGYKYYLGATVDPETVKRIDRMRGEIPRSRVVERALLQFLERGEKNNLVVTKTQGERTDQ